MTRRGRAPTTHLRVAAGEAGGRRLTAPRGIRPTSAMVKEAIFNLVGTAVTEACVLDLFAGSGALGIEALSRGAASATFVDNDDEAIKAVKRNLETMGVESRGRAERADAARWLRAHPDRAAEASLVLLDPPYNDAVLDHVLTLLDGMVAAGATVVAEHAHRQAPPALNRLRVVRARRYGDSAVTVYEAPSSGDPRRSGEDEP